MWFDTHVHLSDPQFDADRSAVIDRAVQAAVGTLVEIADGPSEWAKAEALSESFPENVWWAAGLHPYYADQSSPEVWARLKKIARHPRFVAVGEVGLDYAKCKIPADVQKASFAEAIELAIDLQKPLIIHCRDAYHDLHPILEKYFKNKPYGALSPGVVHCFSGNADDASRVLAYGFYLGVDGPVTYPKADALRSALENVPIDKLVLETDSPYLPPQTHRGQRNEPQHVIAVGHRLGLLKRMGPTEAAAQFTLNGLNLYRIKPQ